ncbi:hypothetical protein FRX31_002020 [Thalictrum thalictroides]|uniref:Uncharacterized protein n=1 Tax=Thalictrum thalictroides TaxID=46969 RepID=A0A7J6XFS4_THATH|nr:hypothetical protein FRX31_002020 [Thalictrum thalictroides]
MIRNEEEKRLMKVREFCQRLIAISKWKDSLINFICTSFISFASYVVLTNWLASGLIIALDLKLHYRVMYVLGFIAGLAKWMEFNAVWNLGAAMSKEKHNALEQISKTSSFLASLKKSSTRVWGLSIIVLQFSWCFGTSISTLIKGEDDYKIAIHGGIIDAGLYAFLIWWKFI